MEVDKFHINTENWRYPFNISWDTQLTPNEPYAKALYHPKQINFSFCHFKMNIISQPFLDETFCHQH